MRSPSEVLTIGFAYEWEKKGAAGLGVSWSQVETGLAKRSDFLNGIFF